MISPEWKQRPDTTLETLNEEFKNPGREWYPYALWIWSDRNPKPRFYRYQATDFPTKHLSAYVHENGFMGGLELYYKCLASVIEESKRVGASIGYCESQRYQRSSELRDGHPELLARSLCCEPQTLYCGSSIVVDNSCFFTAAAKIGENGLIDSGTLTMLEPLTKFTARYGDWRIYAFEMFNDQTMEGTSANMLHHNIGEQMLKLFHQKVFRRFKEHLGDTLSGFLYNNCGDYGYKLCWSEELEAYYSNKTGRDFRLNCPLLLEKDSQGKWMRARYDWFDCVSELYSEFVFAKCSRELEARGMTFSTFSYAERCLGQALLCGDPMRIYRAVSLPGANQLYNDPNVSRSYKEAQSVAEFEGKRLLGRIFGVSGWRMKPNDYRRMVNNAVAMGVNHFVLYGINSDRTDIRNLHFPPDIYDWAPSWEWMNHLNDYIRRASYIASQGQMIAETLIYSPLESFWALTGDAAFDNVVSYSREWVYDKPNLYGDFEFGGEMHDIDDSFTSLIERLTGSLVSFLIADRHYIDEAVVEDGALRIGGRRFTSIVLPPLRILTVRTMEKLLDFLNSGGRVISVGGLPDASAEEGLGDPAMLSLSGQMRGHPGFIGSENAETALNELPVFCRVESGGFPLRAQQRRIDGRLFYWLSNNSLSKRRAALFLPDAHGLAHIYEPEYGSTRAVPTEDLADGSRVVLEFEEGEGFFLSFDPEQTALKHAPPEPGRVTTTLTGKWKILIDPERQMQSSTGVPIVVPDNMYIGITDELRDWSEYGIPDFSGCVEYEKEFVLDEASDVSVDLGEVCWMASVSVDGSEEVSRFWGPYRFTFRNLAPGTHILHVHVGNLIVNHLYRQVIDPETVIWEHCKPKPEDYRSGLFGPVTITSFRGSGKE